MLDPARRGLYVHYEIEEDVENQYAALAELVDLDRSPTDLDQASSSSGVSTPQLSTKASSEILLPLSPGCDVYHFGGNVPTNDDVNGLSAVCQVPSQGEPWGTGSGSDGEHVRTPPAESEDPFGLDPRVWSDVPLDDDVPVPVPDSLSSEHRTKHDRAASTVSQGAKQSCNSRRVRERRPPPLDLQRKTRKRRETACYTHPSSFRVGHSTTMSSQIRDNANLLQSAFDDWDDEPLPAASTPVLLSPLPILSPGAFKARSSSGKSPTGLSNSSAESSVSNALQAGVDEHENTVDMESALEELIRSCGEGPPRMDWYHYAPPTPSRSADLVSSRIARNSSAQRARRLSDAGPGKDSLNAFPLPPQRPPVRPPRKDDMGVEFIASLDLDLHSPASPELVTPRSPNTPQRRSAMFAQPFALSSPPAPKVRLEYDRNWEPQLRGDHSFLNCMSSGSSRFNQSSSTVNSFGSYRSFESTSSTRSLPKRSPLPSAWQNRI